MPEEGKLQEQINRMEVALLGYDGHPGLCKQFDRLTKDYYTFKKNCLVVFGILIGSGVLGLCIERMWF